MRDFLETLAWVAFATFLVAAGGAALGGLLIWSLIQRAGGEALDASDPLDVYAVDEATVEVPVIAPVLARWFDEDFAEFEPEPELGRAVAHRPMSAMERLEGPTVRIRIGRDVQPEPWLRDGRHRRLESRCRVPMFLDAPQATFEFPQVGTHRTDEYPLLEGVG